MLGIKFGIASLAVLLALLSPLSAHSDGIAEGKALVEVNCARCHAVTRTSEGKHPNAPPFWALSQRYPIDALEEAFAEGISTGHPDMPEFVATPHQIDVILDYISTLNE